MNKPLYRFMEKNRKAREEKAEKDSKSKARAQKLRDRYYIWAVFIFGAQTLKDFREIGIKLQGKEDGFEFSRYIQTNTTSMTARIKLRPSWVKNPSTKTREIAYETHYSSHFGADTTVDHIVDFIIEQLCSDLK